MGVKHADATAVGDLTPADVERAQQQDHLAATHRQLEALGGEPAEEACGGPQRCTALYRCSL